jgi:phosphatidylserine decarboxylase
VADRAVGVPIVKEGFPFVGIGAGVTLLAGLLGWTVLGLAAGGLTLFTAWFFRNPSRVVPQGPGLVVAPGDGTVIAVEEEFEPRFIKDRSVRLSIFLNVFDVHVNRIPCEGVVENIQYQPGAFLVASKPDATLKNEQNALFLRTAQGAKIVCVQVAGLIARRIVCWLSPDEHVMRGERFGLIRFGSRMDTFVPLGTDVRVAVGDRVKGGETVVGVLR